MAEQFDWSAVLERIKGDGEPVPAVKPVASNGVGKVDPVVAPPAPPAPPATTAPPAPPVPMPPVAETPPPPVAVEPSLEAGPLAWDEDDIPAPVEVQPERPREFAPDPVIALDWDDETPATPEPLGTATVADVPPMEVVEGPPMPPVPATSVENPSSDETPAAPEPLGTATVADVPPMEVVEAPPMPPVLATSVDEQSSVVVEAPPAPVCPPEAALEAEPVMAPPAQPADERPAIKLLPTAFDRELGTEAEAEPVADDAPTAPATFSMSDLDALKSGPAPAVEPGPAVVAECLEAASDLDETSTVPVEEALPDSAEPAVAEVKAETKPTPKKPAKAKAEDAPKAPELKLVKRDGPTSFGLSDKRLGAALLDVKAVTRKQLEEALAQQVETAEPLGKILVRKGLVTVAKVLQVVAMQRGLDAWDLELDPPKPDATGLVQGETCQRLGVLPVAVRGDLLVLAMVDPDDTAAVDEVRKEAGLRVQPVLADPERLAALVQRNYHLDARSSSVMDTLVDQALKTAKESGHANTKERATVTEEETRPVVGFVNQIIHDAIRMHASDIHIEPRFDRAEIRYRLDGQLMTMREVPQALVPMVTTRLKIMAELDIVEYRVPQDGRISLQLGKNTIDLRVSCLPSLHGQRIVMRVLDKSIGLRRLDELGFDAENLTILRSLVEKPYGLLFATGPTGSGKTTTLYAAIQEMRRDGQNVMTCEDPVEYDLEGVNQSQVNERVGLTFAEQLRAILRQDPDIVLVGEVRDHETAETAVRAAMTGHMVLSTLHCNDAPSAIARLLDLGVDPFLLSTSLIGSMSQRLVRRLCAVCRREEAPTDEESDMMERHFGVQGVDSIWHAVGCDKCHNTGYKGRVAVSEIMPVVEEIAALIAARASLEQIRASAALYGYLPMQSDAMVRVARGETSLEEARRTVFFDTIQRRDKPRSIAV
ncbi:MAG: Flp pilus assembly complex ATPase component TadA [Fimbriimonadaceae bacterium]|nr:Flp pilus assembly complex ATPase component TadA [Fimbriimonadaceae bacterium]